MDVSIKYQDKVAQRNPPVCLTFTSFPEAKWRLKQSKNAESRLRCPPIIFLKDQERKLVPRKKTKQANHELEQRNLPREPVFAQWTAPDKPQVKNGKIARLDKVAVFIRSDF